MNPFDGKKYQEFVNHQEILDPILLRLNDLIQPGKEVEFAGLLADFTVACFNIGNNFGVSRCADMLDEVIESRRID